MLRILAFGVMLAVMASPVLAAPRCSEPYAPDIHGGAGSTKQQMLGLASDAQAFLTASGLYQDCLAQAVKSDSLFAGKARDLIASNQREKQRIGDAYNSAVKAYNAANGGNAVVADNNAKP